MYSTQVSGMYQHESKYKVWVFISHVYLVCCSTVHCFSLYCCLCNLVGSKIHYFSNTQKLCAHYSAMSRSFNAYILMHGRQRTQWWAASYQQATSSRFPCNFKEHRCRTQWWATVTVCPTGMNDMSLKHTSVMLPLCDFWKNTMTSTCVCGLHGIIYVGMSLLSE